MIKEAINHASYISKKFILGNNRGLILCYHRVLPEKKIMGYGPNSGLIISTENFEQQMSYLSSYRTPVTLEELLGTQKQFPEKPKVVVTFDDGNVDNLIYALPILEKYNIPATFYITTGFILGEIQPWWLQLWNCLKMADEFELPELVSHRKLQNNAQRVESYREIHYNILNGNYSQYKFIYDYLQSKALPIDDQDRYFSIDEIRHLANHPLITIGAHTHTHTPFNYLSLTEMKNELAKGNEFLRIWSGKQPEHFAYPYGTDNEIGKHHFDVDHFLEIKSAVTTNLGAVSSSDAIDRFNLPRLCVVPKMGMSYFKMAV
jgi:peptidoglycan/xylan/chitin deacetylase (PgdA/CDA1 family)